MTWRVGLLVALPFIGSVVVLLAIVTRPIAPPPHEIFVNGHILTMDALGTIAEAVSVRDGRVEAIGRSEDLLRAADEQTSIIDLRGRTLMPGFVDAHGHFPASGQTVFSADLNSPPLGDITTMLQLVERMRKLALERPDGWIFGHGYDDTLIAEKRHPTRDDLDQVSFERPVAVTHVSGHIAVANSVALTTLGIDELTLDPEGGVIVRDPKSAGRRRPNGVLEETAARAIWDHMLDLGVLDALRMTTQAAEEYLQVGVTTASAGGMPASVAKFLGLLSRFNQFPQRVAIWLRGAQASLYLRSARSGRHPAHSRLWLGLVSEWLAADAFYEARGA